MFKPIENTINKTELKKALVDWIINDVTVDELHNVIPWSDDLETLIDWNDVRESIDNEVDKCGKQLTNKPWNIGEIITDSKECDRFNKFVDEYVDNIVKIFDSYIEQANKKKQLITKNTQSVDDMVINADIAYVANCMLDDMFMKDYVDTIFNAIIEDVIADVKECADKEFSNDDVRLAVNRAILKKLGASI
jgi:archaellum component FlaC